MLTPSFPFSLFLLLPVLVSKLQSQVNFLILNLPSRHVPFKSVYNQAVGRCYELHCDKALCKPSLSVWLSVCLSLVSSCLCFPLFCFFFPSAHSSRCISISGFSLDLGRECTSLSSWVQDCSGPRCVVLLELHLLELLS